MSVSIAKQIQASNAQLQAGNITQLDTVFFVEAGNFLTNHDEVENLIVGTNQGHPVYLKQVDLMLFNFSEMSIIA